MLLKRQRLLELLLKRLKPRLKKSRKKPRKLLELLIKKDLRQRQLNMHLLKLRQMRKVKIR